MLFNFPLQTIVVICLVVVSGSTHIKPISSVVKLKESISCREFLDDPPYILLEFDVVDVETCKGDSDEFAIELGKNSCLKLSLSTSNEVWRYDVPPNPYFSKSWLLCGEEINQFYMPVQKGFHKLIVTIVDRITQESLGYSTLTEYFYSGGDSAKMEIISQYHAVNLRKLYEERKEISSNKEKLRQSIIDSYHPKHLELFQLSEDIFDEQFLQAYKSGDALQYQELLTRESRESKLFSFQLFTKEFCDKFLQEIEHFEKTSPVVNRPNSMNNYGVILDEFGFYPFLQELLDIYITPLAHLLYPEWGTRNISSHHGFVVEYQIGKDHDLDYHMDQSAITLNIGLGKEFEGGDLYFNGVRGHSSESTESAIVRHDVGRALIHVGQHWHGAKSITSGERYNLILWGRSDEFLRSSTEGYMLECQNNWLNMF
eukprot:TRINITY_DN7180_c0_g1_i2.p1 TRINITY_DN7180_c0_g1~~TRINITY_DN7180_c0_g1_i2.p1  ORF type:complete len:428 (-),score=83.20 TRINITY_DN7180_c0_g1_i2:42-1325(-)